MSLQLILGGSGSGKTTRLDQIAIEQSRKHPDQNVFVIVPEQYTMQTQRSIADMSPGHCVMNLDILSFNRLAYRIFDEVGQNAVSLLGDTGKNMIIRKILIEHEEDLYAYRGNIRRAGFTGQVSSLLSELIEYDISPEELDRRRADFADDAMLYTKLSDLTVLYKAFMDEIHEKYMTAEEVPDLLCRVIGRSQMLKGSYIYMDNFTGFTPVQYRLICRLLEIAEQVVITLPVDPGMQPYRPAQMSELFYLTKETIRKLNELCREHRIHRDEDILLSENLRAGGELAMLEKNIFRSWIQVWHDRPEQIELINTPSIDDEMRVIAQKIHALVSCGQARYREIAVISANAEGCRRSAQYWMQRYDIPCFFDFRRPVGTNMLPRWLLSLLDMLRKNFSYDCVFAYLKCGLSGFDFEETDLLDNYTLAFGIRGWSRWNREWTYGAAGKPKGRYGAPVDLEKINALRVRFVSQMKELHKLSGKKETTALAIIRGIYQLMDSLETQQQLKDMAEEMRRQGRPSEAAEYDQIYDAVIDTFEKMAQVLGDEQMSITEFRDILSSAFESLSIGIIPPGLDEVTFGDIRRTRLDRIRFLFFADLTDNNVPAPAAGGSLLTERERQLMSDQKLVLAPTDKETICTERYYLYSIMTKPSENLYLLYPSSDSGGADCSPSDILKQIGRIFEKLEVQRPTDEPVDTIQAGRMLIDGLRRAAAEGKTEPAVMTVYRWMKENPAYCDFAQRAADAAFYTYQEERLSPHSVRDLYGAHMEGSVSELETYASCAFACYLRYGLGLDERRVFRLKAPDFGMIYHTALEHFVRKLHKDVRDWRKMDDAERDRFSDECVDAAVMSYNNQIMKDSHHYEYLISRVRRIMRRTAWAVTEQLRRGLFEPADFEMVFRGYDPSGTGRGRLRLNGRIDRMDLYLDRKAGREYIKIIDYKSSRRKIDYTGLYGGTQMQLFIYLSAALESEKERLKQENILSDTAPAGVFYYHVDDPVLEAGPDILAPASDQKTEDDKLLQELRLEGLAVADDEVIRYMDQSPEKTPQILPLKYNKDKKLSAASDAAPPEDFREIMQYVNKKAVEIGEGIYAGRTDIRPYRSGSSGGTACEYCSYRAVCGFDTRLSGYRYRRVPSMNRKTFLEWLKGGGSDE